MRAQIVDGCQVLTDGKTVWVNAANGNSIARLSPYGIDVHAPDIAAGTHCLDCGPADAHIWPRFLASVLKHHKLRVPDNFRPGWCRV